MTATSSNVSTGRLLLTFEGVCRIVLGGVFIYSACSKIVNPAQFALSVAAYQFLPSCFVGLFSLVLPMVELVAGIAIVFTKWSREASALISCLLGMFLVGLVQALVRGLKISCGCFGSDSPEADTLQAALVRDLVLLGPACFLAFRPRRWLPVRQWSVNLSVLVISALIIAGFMYWHRPVSQVERREAVEREIGGIGTNAVPAEVWTKDFPSALVESRRHHRPLILYVGNKNCRFCAQMREALSGQAFGAWIKGTGIYLAEGLFSETNSLAQTRLLVDYLHSSKQKRPDKYPYVAFYWPKDDVGGTSNAEGAENLSLFVGRRSEMPGAAHRTLVGQFINAGNAFLNDYFSKYGSRSKVDELIKLESKKISAAIEDGGKGGTVKMRPANGVLELESVVYLSAKPAPHMRLVGWRGPDGQMVPKVRSSTLAVRSNMMAGTYTAVYEPVVKKRKATGVKK